MTRIVTLVGFVLITCGPVAAQFTPPAEKPKGPWMDSSLSPDKRADLVVAAMTLDEKISLLHGGGWRNDLCRSQCAAVEIAGQRRIHSGHSPPWHPRSADGRCRGRSDSHCRFRPLFDGAALRAWPKLRVGTCNLAREYGALIGRELRNQGYNMSLGGGLNLTREPRNGRIFEYQAAKIRSWPANWSGAEMKALQERGHLGDIKHYAMNDQENGRSYVNVHIGQARHARERSAGFRDWRQGVRRGRSDVLLQPA